MMARRSLLACAFAGILYGAALLLGLHPTGSAGAASAPGVSWSTYHGDALGSGVASGLASVNTTSPAWQSKALDGQLFGQPVAVGASIFVATENDTVYALNATNGTPLWSTHVGSPVPSSSLPCGNISPTVGVTGTPVIDVAKSELYVVADELINGAPAHVLLGLNTTTGKIELNQNIDPAGSDPAALLQRTGLSLDQGRVILGFGGNYGDCGAYHGWVVSVPEGGGTPHDFEIDSAAGEREGAVWMGGGAPAIDSAGNIWVSAGNGSVTSSGHAYDNSDSVLELSPSLSLLQYFAPTTWPSDNAADKDFSATPALLADGEVVIAGKSRVVYLLNGAHLGGIGAQQASLPSGCGDDIDGGMAVVGTTVYLPCLTGTQAVQVTASPPSLHLAWGASVGGGPPIVAAGLVWTIDQDGHLYGLNPNTGKTVQQGEIGVPANHFPTPGVGAGLMLATSANRVVAFSTTASGSAPSTSTTTSTTTTSVPTTSTTHGPKPSRIAVRTLAPRDGGLSAGAIVGIALGAIAIGAGVLLFLRRRRGAAP